MEKIFFFRYSKDKYMLKTITRYSNKRIWLEINEKAVGQDEKKKCQENSLCPKTATYKLNQSLTT